MPPIQNTFRTAGAIDGAKKHPSEFRTAMNSAITLMRKTYGKSRARSESVSSALSRGEPSPNTSGGRTRATTTPITVIATRTSESSVKMLWKNRNAAGRPFCCCSPEKTGTNALDTAPSPKISRNRFGSRNATTKASITAPAPRRAANAMSRTRPRIRETKMAPETTPAERKTERLSGVCSFTAPPEKREVSRRPRVQ